MKRFFTQTLMAWGPLGVLVLSFVESLGIPNPSGTDFLLLAVSIARPEKALLCAALAVAGSLTGSLVFYQIMKKGGDKLLARYTSSGRGARFRAWTQRYGLVTVYVSALVPLPILPLKVFAACACAMGVSRKRFLGVLLAARIPRYGGLAYLGVRLGQDSGAWIKSHTWEMGTLALALFAGLYALLKWLEREPGAPPRAA